MLVRNDTYARSYRADDGFYQRGNGDFSINIRDDLFGMGNPNELLLTATHEAAHWEGWGMQVTNDWEAEQVAYNCLLM